MGETSSRRSVPKIFPLSSRQLVPKFAPIIEWLMMASKNHHIKSSAGVPAIIYKSTDNIFLVFNLSTLIKASQKMKCKKKFASEAADLHSDSCSDFLAKLFAAAAKVAEHRAPKRLKLELKDLKVDVFAPGSKRKKSAAEKEKEKKVNHLIRVYGQWVLSLFWGFLFSKF